MISPEDEGSSSSFNLSWDGSPDLQFLSSGQNTPETPTHGNWDDVGAWGFSGIQNGHEENQIQISPRMQKLRDVERDAGRLNAFLTEILTSKDENGTFEEEVFNNDSWDFRADELFQFIWKQTTGILDSLFQLSLDGCVEDTYALEDPEIGRMNLALADGLDNCAIDSMVTCKWIYSQIAGSGFGQFDCRQMPLPIGQFSIDANPNGFIVPAFGEFNPRGEIEEDQQLRLPLSIGFPPIPSSYQQIMSPQLVPAFENHQPEPVKFPLTEFTFPALNPGPCVTHTIPVILLQYQGPIIDLDEDEGQVERQDKGAGGDADSDVIAVGQDPNLDPIFARRLAWFVPPTDGLLGAYPNAPKHERNQPPPIMLPPGLEPSSDNPQILVNTGKVPLEMVPIASTCEKCMMKLETTRRFYIRNVQDFIASMQTQPLAKPELLPFPKGPFQDNPDYNRMEQLGTLMTRFNYENKQGIMHPHVCYKCGFFGPPGALQSGFPVYPIFR